MTLTIRLVRPEEHQAVDTLVIDAYTFDYGPRKQHADPRQLHLAANRARDFEVWVALDEAQQVIVGTITTAKAGGEHLMEDSTPDELDFRLLGVSPDRRGEGIGEALTNHVLRLAHDRGYQAVFMKSAPDMLKAHQLYFKLGFERDIARDGLIIGGEKRTDLLAFRRAAASVGQPA